MTRDEAYKKGRDYGWEYEAARKSLVGWLLPSASAVLVLAIDHAGIEGEENTKAFREGFSFGSKRSTG